MDLLDLIESHRFMGTEFLVWLWYKCDVFEGRFVIGRHGVCEVWFDDRITLEAMMTETEQSVLKGAAPTTTPEANEALRQGKMPVQAKLRIICDGREFQFVLKAPALQTSGIKLPALMTKADDEKFYERMSLMEQLEAIIEDLYAEYLALRLTTNAWKVMHKAIQAWVYEEHTEDTMDRESYRTLLGTTKVPGRMKRSVRVARADAEALSEAVEAEKAEEAADTADATTPA